ncbi:hypothetical protein [Rossellomorea aquimaris]|uniref:hypothetical protein n=1 Tax=Rossellomorea aquimaris TaxID=189382 RepID=UPI0009FA4AED|nr:hypothetical protein [Rossellomorea aquimaris]
MELNGSDFKDRALHAMHALTDNMKERFYSIADIPSSAVPELAEFVKQHPDTEVMEKHLLGNSYMFYTLNMDNYQLYLETREDRILQLDGYTNGKKFVSHRSYRDFEDLHSPIKLN